MLVTFMRLIFTNKATLKGVLVLLIPCKMDWINFIVLFSFYIGAHARYFAVPAGEEDWFASGQQELRRALQRAQLNNNTAKNVIFFLGDGMSLTTVWAARVYGGQYQGQRPGAGDEHRLHFESFPHVSLAKTYNVDQQIADSAGTATAFLCGVKANAGTVGVSHHVVRSNCSLEAANRARSILHWSMDAGKSTGIVTSARLTHATPAAAYAHSAERKWENDAAQQAEHYGVPAAYNQQFGCKDIALQLIEDNPNINVLMGGGRTNFGPSPQVDVEYPETNRRTDGRDLVQEWRREKESRGASHAYVTNKAQLEAVDTSITDFLMGLFEPSHLQYELERNASSDPSLAELVHAAVKVLRRDEDGFFLLVEGGRIDHAHHSGYARLALHETWAMDQAVKVAMEMTSAEDTLIVVTADHSHSFTSGGYTRRGNDILGLIDNLATNEITDGLPATTLVYGNGPGAVAAQPRLNLTGSDTTAPRFRAQAAVPMLEETHSGEDVPVYARGPGAHLFSGVYEQHYLAHAMAYASCVGANTAHCQPSTAPSSRAHPRLTAALVLSLIMMKL